MEEQDWLLNEIDNLIKQETVMKDRAFYVGLKKMVKEQIKRLDQNSGELDGRIWNPSKWS